MQNVSRLVVPVAIAIVVMLPTSAFAQQAQTNGISMCGTPAVPMATPGTLIVPQPDTMGMHDQGVLDFSAVRGSIVHMEGDMVLLKLDNLGMGNAAPNHELAGDTWA